MNAKEFADLLIKNDLATEDELRGCSEEEIKKLEKHIGSKLPQDYREFLNLVGHDAGVFNYGSHYLYEILFDVTERAREIMIDGPYKLPADAFVIFSHQECIFAYFKLLEIDNPAMYTYRIGEPAPTEWATSFSEYLEKSFNEEMSSLNKLKSQEEYIQHARVRKYKQI